jgi:hypothetical protein
MDGVDLDTRVLKDITKISLTKPKKLMGSLLWQLWGSCQNMAGASAFDKMVS